MLTPLVKTIKPQLSNISPKAKVGAGTVLHAGVHIHDDVVIGEKCKIQALAFIPNGVVIEDEVFVGPGVVFTNDKNPKAMANWELRKTLIKKGAAIGANATILPGLIVGEGATVGAGSVLTKDVPPGETWAGNPARKLK